MSINNNKTNQKPHHTPASEPKAGKRGLLLRFIIFMAQVVAIGLLISLIAYQPSEPIIFIVRVGNL